MEVNEIDWAYLAGLVDGEGCISLVRLPRHNQLRVALGNTNKEIIGYLHNLFGGHESMIVRPKPGKLFYQWILSASNAYGFIWGILPFLRIKDKQAKLGLYHQNIILRRKGKRNRWNPLSLKEKALDEYNFNLMKSYNAKGVHHRS